MLDRIIRFSLRNRLAVVVGVAALVVWGAKVTRDMDIDVFPDLTAPTVVVMTDAHGMAAEEVERLVTFPIETAVNGAAEVRRVRSASLQGSSFVWVEFDWGADIYRARQTVGEKLTTLAGALPEGVAPALAPQSSVMGEILFIGLQADSTPMGRLRELADWVVKPAILSTGGVSQVTVIGGDYKQYQVVADPSRMQFLGVTLDELTEAAATASLNATGGVARDHGNEYPLIGAARTSDPAELGAALVATRGGQPVTIADVARVQVGSAPKMGHASLDARPAVILAVSKQPSINTLRVTEAIERNLESLRPALPADVRMDTRIFRQADFIEASVGNVGSALLEGALFVVVVLFLFLGSFRTTLISVVAIPLSLLGTMIALWAMGHNVNTMTLGGMCIAIGSLVDDAIIDVENVFKRLRQNRALPAAERRPGAEVVFDASREIRASILNATFIIMVAFAPLFFLSGMEGRMLRPLGVAYIVSLGMSLLVAMTVTPLLCDTLLTSGRYLDRKERGGRLQAWLAPRYERSLRWALGHGRAITAATLAALLGAAALAAGMGRGFLPDFNEGSLTISAVARPGISLDQSDAVGNLIERQLLAIPEVAGTARRTGRGELDEHSQATNSAEIDVAFRLGRRPQEAFLADVRARLAAIPGIATTVGQPLGHRIDHMLTGTRATIAVKIFGPDLARLFALGNQVKEAAAGVAGVADLSVEQQTETPQIQIRPSRALLARHGITLGQFDRFVETAFGGAKVGEIYEGQRSFDLVVRLDGPQVPDIAALRGALIDTRGGKIPLEEVAEIVSTGGPNSISRENAQRRIVVSANTAGRDVAGVVDDIRSSVSRRVALPEGYRIEYGGQFESAQRASRTLALASLLSLAAVALLLYAEFRRGALTAIVLLNLPLALIGGVVAIALSSNVVSIPSIIGFITLFGIATRNGILLISNYRHAREQGAELREAIVRGSADRLAPILMTALTAALALVPLVANGAKSGNEIQSPMAVVVLGGLLTSTFLNIYIIPIVYQWYAQREARKEDGNR